MTRLSILTVLLALGVLVGLSAEKPAVAARRATTVRVANVSTKYTITYNSQAGKVRTYDLPPNYDEKGNVKKYTAAELKDLKGKDSNLPGYESSFDQLQTGQVLKVTLARTKEPAKSDKDNDKDEDKDKDKDLDKDKSADKKSEVTLILIKSDGTSSSDSSKPAKP